MNLIFVKNLGFSRVCERSPYLYLLGEGEARSPTMFYPRLSKMGLRPISSGALRPPPAPLLLRLHLASGFVCVRIGGKFIPLLLRGWRASSFVASVPLCAVMGTRQRFPFVRTVLRTYPTTFAKCLVGILRCSNGD